MANIIQPPFYIPRPSDDFPHLVSFFQLVGGINPTLSMLTAGGIPPAVFVIPNPPDQSLAQWVGTPLDSAIIQQLTHQQVFGAGGQVRTKHWALIYGIYDDPGPLLLGQVALLTANNTLNLNAQVNSIVKPIRWGQFNYYDDAAPWQGKSTKALTQYLTKPFVPNFWRNNYDDSAYWVGSPTGSKLLVPILTAQAPTKFWRWDYDQDPALWLGKPVANQLILTPTGAPFTPIFWQYNYDDQGNWVGKPVASAVLSQLLTVGGQPPTKVWSQFTTYDDPAVWLGQPIAASLNTTLAIVANPFTPIFWSPKAYDDSAVWTGQAFKSQVLADLLTAGGQPPTKVWSQFFNTYDDSAFWLGKPTPALTQYLVKPFVPRFWNFNYDDAAVWYTPLTPDPTNYTALLLNKPFVPVFWKYPYDDSAFWLGRPFASSTIPSFTVGGQPPTKVWSQFTTWDDSAFWLAKSTPALTQFLVKPFVPFFWKYNYDDAAYWVNQSRSSAVLGQLLTAAGQPPTKVWSQFTTYDDPAVWTGQATTNLILDLFQQVITFFGAQGQAPTKTWSQFTTYDDQAVWTGKPLASSTIPSFTVGGQPPTKVWSQFTTWDDAGFWQGKPTPALAQFLVKPFVPLFWQRNYNYDDAAYWVGQARSSALLVPILTVQAPTKVWSEEYTQDDPAVWSGKPLPSAVLSQLLTAGGQPPTKPWHYDFDDLTSSWLAKPLAIPQVNLSVVPSPFVPVFWQYNYDDQSYWIGKSLASSTIASFTIGGQPPTKVWSQFTTQDDAAFWQGKSTPSLYVPGATPFAAVFWRYNYDDATVWTGKAVPNPSLLAITPFVPNFWRYNYDDQAVWTGKPLASAVLSQLLTAGGEVRAKLWSEFTTYDDPAFWQGKSLPSAGLLPPLALQPPTKEWSEWLTQDDATFWLAKPTATPEVLLSFVKPFVPYFFKFGWDDPAFWTWQFSPNASVFAPTVVELDLIGGQYTIVGSDVVLTAPAIAAPQPTVPAPLPTLGGGGLGGFFRDSDYVTYPWDERELQHYQIDLGSGQVEAKVSELYWLVAPLTLPDLLIAEQETRHLWNIPEFGIVESYPTVEETEAYVEVLDEVIEAPEERIEVANEVIEAPKIHYLLQTAAGTSQIKIGTVDFNHYSPPKHYVLELNSGESQTQVAEAATHTARRLDSRPGLHAISGACELSKGLFLEQNSGRYHSKGLASELGRTVIAPVVKPEKQPYVSKRARKLHVNSTAYEVAADLVELRIAYQREIATALSTIHSRNLNLLVGRHKDLEAGQIAIVASTVEMQTGGLNLFELDNQLLLMS